MNRDEPTTIPEPTPNRCSCSFPHMPHDYCDGNPNALMFDILPCEGCGVRSDRTEYIGINLLNGHLRLCRACLDELNEKSPLLAAERRRAEAAEANSWRSMKHCTIHFKECEKGHGWLTADNWVQHGCPTCERAETVERCATVAESFHGAEKWIGDVRDIAHEIRQSIGGKP